MYSRVLFYRRYIRGESEDEVRSLPLDPIWEMYARYYFESDFGQLCLAILRLRREIGRALRIDKIAGYLSKLIR